MADPVLVAIKADAMVARAAAMAADDVDAQRAAETTYNAAVAMETAARRHAAVKARIKAEEAATAAGYEAAVAGLGPEAVVHVAKNLRAQWTEGWNAYWA